MKINRAELGTCCKFLQSISICRCSMRAPSVVSQILYLYSSSVHSLLSKSGICDAIAAVICLRNLGKVTVSECTQHIHCPHAPSKKNPKGKNPDVLGQVKKNAMCYKNPTNQVPCKLVGHIRLPDKWKVARSLDNTGRN
jgi:hypothetical protein